MSYLLDSGFWFALLNHKEQTHEQVLAAAQQISGPIVTATVVLTEVAYLVRRDLGSAALAAYLDSLTTADYVLVEPTAEDYHRAAAIIRQYRDAHIDFVDAVLVAIAERLNITQVLTLDQRHFRLFRPQHCDAFDILP
jgi:predicted nucleic acid-binding protein